jgi:hypothetical protein
VKWRVAQGKKFCRSRNQGEKEHLLDAYGTAGIAIVSLKRKDDAGGNFV